MVGRIINSLVAKDARLLADVIKKQIVDVIITSPPYADLKNYGTKEQIGFGQDYENEYLPALKEVFGQCFKVSRAHATLWIVANTFRRDGEVRLLPFEIATICKEVGWILRDIIVWDKGKSLPWSHKGRLRDNFEYLLFFTKSSDHKYYIERIKDPIDLKEWWVKYPERYSFGGKVPSNIWRIPIPVQGSWASDELQHFCPFPPELVERILLLTTDKGDIALDPFSGSGVVLAEAMCMGRKYIGFEINPDYVHRFKTKVLPATRSKWRQTQKEMRRLERRRRKFEETIRTLRLLKYPRAILKALHERADEAAQIVSVFVEGNPVRPAARERLNGSIEGKVIFFVRDISRLYMERLQEEINRIVSRPPVSKFGVKALISVELASSMTKNLDGFMANGRRQLHVYLGGRTYSYAERISWNALVDKLLDGTRSETLRNGLPPIVSPIGIKQEIVKTWISRSDKAEA